LPATLDLYPVADGDVGDAAHLNVDGLVVLGATRRHPPRDGHGAVVPDGRDFTDHLHDDAVERRA